MVERELYRQVGGFPECYVQIDFEDSDLCLRLIEAGRENWYVASVELYHLEGQSFQTQARHRNSTYNRWLHTRLWDDQIKAAMTRYGSPTLPARSYQ
jgi:GT2 family glycosyltransferase